MKCDWYVKNGRTTTYEVKDVLWDMGCTYNKQAKSWMILKSSKRDDLYKALKAMGLKLIPINLSKENQKIQDILNGK